MFDVRRVVVDVTLAKLPVVREWFRANANTFFTFRDVDRVERLVRVRGGFASISFAAVDTRVLLDGDRFFRAEIELEGYW